MEPCVIGLEACGGAQFWARQRAKLGHDARLMPARYVRAYVKTNKHDAAACCEAIQRLACFTTRSGIGTENLAPVESGDIRS
jgi:transposase